MQPPQRRRRQLTTSLCGCTIYWLVAMEFRDKIFFDNHAVPWTLADGWSATPLWPDHRTENSRHIRVISFDLILQRPNRCCSLSGFKRTFGLWIRSPTWVITIKLERIRRSPYNFSIAVGLGCKWNSISADRWYRDSTFAGSTKYATYANYRKDARITFSTQWIRIKNQEQVGTCPFFLY